MWKIIVAFIAFAALALFVIMKGGDSLDMSGEKHLPRPPRRHRRPRLPLPPLRLRPAPSKMPAIEETRWPRTATPE